MKPKDPEWEALKAAIANAEPQGRVFECGTPETMEKNRRESRRGRSLWKDLISRD